MIEINIEDATCNSKALAAFFDVTQRNISHWVEKGMPVLKRGKSGRNHLFKLPWALNWKLGMYACQVWEKQLPGPLETVLTGYALDDKHPGFSFEQWMKDAKALAGDMGYPGSAFYKALQYLITNNLIGWEKRRF